MINRRKYRKAGLLAAILIGITAFGRGTAVNAAEAEAQNAGGTAEAASGQEATGQEGTGRMRGVWIATVCNLDFPSVKTQDAGALAAEIDAQIEGCRELGFNTIFLQVRPSCDAIYPSTVFPWSVYLTGQQGTAPSGGFDPLQYWVDKAHENGMELHAWVNPYRITKYSDTEWNSLSDTNPARQHPEWVVRYQDGNYYFNPGIPQVRELIKQGVAEILTNYAVDGIHMDDYFYPGKVFDDAGTFAEYNNGVFANIEDWRRNNVDTLIRELDTLIHSYGEQIQFGISPAGVWENKSANPLGSDTQGGHPSYSKLYADTRKWALEEWIDYIVPQVYWQIGHSKADYIVLANWWADTLRDSKTKLYIGLADYQGAGASPQNVWYGGAEIARQLDYNKALAKVEGEVHFRYGTIMQDEALKQVIRSAYLQ